MCIRDSHIFVCSICVVTSTEKNSREFCPVYYMMHIFLHACASVCFWLTFLCTLPHACVNSWKHMHFYACMFLRVFACISMRACFCVCLHTKFCACMCMFYVCTYECMRQMFATSQFSMLMHDACVCVCLPVCINSCIYLYIYLHVCFCVYVHSFRCMQIPVHICRKTLVHESACHIPGPMCACILYIGTHAFPP